MIIERLDRFSDELMGFALACLLFEAITRDEFRGWCAIAMFIEAAPPYLSDLVDYDGEIFKIFNVIGFVPSWDRTVVEEAALYGIAIERGFDPYDMPVSLDEAKECLARSPELDRPGFRRQLRAIINGDERGVYGEQAVHR